MESVKKSNLLSVPNCALDGAHLEAKASFLSALVMHDGRATIIKYRIHPLGEITLIW